MVLEHLPTDKIHAQSVPALEHLLRSNQVARFARTYLISCQVEGKSPRTVEVYSMVLRRYAEYTPSLSTDDVRHFLLNLHNKGVSPSTTHIYYRSLKTFFNWIVAEGLIKKNPMEHIKSPRLPKTVIKPFSHQDIIRLIVLTSGGNFLDARNRAMILVLLDTGIRLAELTGIQLGDVNLSAETIRVLGKGSKERYVRIGRTTQKAILRYLAMREDGYDSLWVTQERKPMTMRGVQIALRRLTRRAEITGTKLGPHTFRHTAAINYLRNGGDQFTLQLMLGHSTLEMTRRYVSTLGTEDMIRVHRKASPVDNMRI